MAGDARDAAARVCRPKFPSPTGFRSPAQYRIFVQVKRAGKVETGIFDARVE